MGVSGQRYDVAVIGGGINGAGIARDAAMRGLSVILLEKRDFGSGTSWASSRLIHGGLRYLEYGEIPLVYESLHERRALRRIAGHLVKPLKLCIPIYASARRGPWLIRLGMLAYDLLSFGKSLPRHTMLTRERTLAEYEGVQPDGLRATACYYDAQVTYAERLVLENVLAARAAGADVRSYSQVNAIRLADGRVTSVCFDDLETGESTEVDVSLVINAAGPWVDRVLNTTAVETGQLIGGTKGSHIVVDPFPGAPQDGFYVEAAADGRPFFILPWNGAYLIGSTDIRYEDELDDIRASGAEVDYLIAETNRVFPAARLGRDDVRYTYAGVRPLPHRKDGPESAITRRHIITENRDIARGLVSIIGGKLTTYRELAEQAVDLAGKLLDRRLPDCRTDDTPLPGGWGIEQAGERLLGVASLSEHGRERLLDVYGGRAMGIAELAAQEPALDVPIDGDGDVIAAEIAWVARNEMPRRLEDLLYRRTMLGLGADQGESLYEAIASIAAQELGWDKTQRQAELDALGAFSNGLREFG